MIQLAVRFLLFTFLSWNEIHICMQCSLCLILEAGVTFGPFWSVVLISLLSLLTRQTRIRVVLIVIFYDMILRWLWSARKNYFFFIVSLAKRISAGSPRGSPTSPSPKPAINGRPASYKGPMMSPTHDNRPGSAVYCSCTWIDIKF